MTRLTLVLLAALLLPRPSLAQTFPGTLIDLPGGAFTMGEDESAYLGPPGSYDATTHSVTLSPFRMGATEVSNQHYADFLNAAEADGLVEVAVESSFPPDVGSTLVYGSDAAPAEYRGQAMLNLSGSRVMKDHGNEDGDGDEFTGTIEPENPLNLTYIGYDAAATLGQRFYVKDPRSTDDFDWPALTTYHNYTSTSRQLDTSTTLNDYDDWEELSDYPNNLPTQAEVANWPATFIRWYGAKAYALYYGLDLPTEAEWEYAAQGGAGFVYATADGEVEGDGTSANWNTSHPEFSRGHVYAVDWGEPNPYGLYNMAGNVWEWLEDWYASDFYAEGAEDPVNLTDSGKKVRRGGSWNYHQPTLKAAARASDEQFKGNDHFGFRVVDRTTTGTGTDPGTLPQAFALEQNYPNPFNPSTVIGFTLSHAGPARLAVYDLLGREVAVLADRAFAPGRHTVRFDAANVAGGLYLYRLTTNTHTATRTLVLLR